MIGDSWNQQESYKKVLRVRLKLLEAFPKNPWCALHETNIENWWLEDYNVTKPMKNEGFQP